MKKIKIHAEIAYIMGILMTALGNALLTHADFGLSMVVAPSYIIHAKLSQYLPFYSFGMSNYIFQALIILLTAAVMRKFKISYLLSFLTAFLFGLSLDALLIPTSFIPLELMAVRIIVMICGMLCVAIGIALLFNTYLPPESYELFIKELSTKSGIGVGRLKTAYDLSSLILSVILSFVLFGFMHFEGMGIGTVVSALLNGTLIGTAAKLFRKYFVFPDLLPLRKFIN